MTDIIHSLLSSVCITIPEYIFIIIITLKLMKRNDMLDLYNLQSNIKSILLIVLPPSILLDISNYIIKFPSSINKLISLIITYILLIYILKKRSYIKYSYLKLKTFIFFILSLLISIAIEIIALPVIFNLINKTYEEIKMNFSLVIICSLSSRIIDLVILIFIFVKKNSKFQISISEYIFKNTFFRKMSISLGIGLIIYEAYVIKLILLNNLLNIVNTIYEQMFVVIGATFIIPSFLISLAYIYINYCIMISSEKADHSK